MENMTHNVPHPQRALIVSDNSIFEDIGQLSPDPSLAIQIPDTTMSETSLQPLSPVKQRFCPLSGVADYV